MLTIVACLSACAWFGSRKPPPVPNPTQIVVTGAPEGSSVLIDGEQTEQAVLHNQHSQVLNVAAGTHKVEIRMGDRIVYREDTFVGAGERTVVIVKSGATP